MSQLPVTVEFNAGSLAEDGTWVFASFEGWDDLPAFDNGSSPHVLGDGSRPGHLRAGDRVVTMAGQVVGRPETVRARIKALSGVFTRTEVELPLTVDFGGDAQTIWARVTARKFDADRMLALGVPNLAVQFTATDPLRYAPVWSQGSTGLASRPAGVSWPLTWPVSWPSSAGSSGSVSLVNDGDAGSPPRLWFAGPVDTPSVVIAGRRLEFGLTLGAAEALIVDCRFGSVRLVPAAQASDMWLADQFPSTAGADRSSTVTTRSVPVQEFRVPAGGSSAAFGAASVSAAAVMHIGWRSASL
jgi:hypothetical protein